MKLSYSWVHYWSLIPIGLLLTIISGCKLAQSLRKKIADKIDVDISIDYIKTDSDSRREVVSFAEVENVKELLLLLDK